MPTRNVQLTEHFDEFIESGIDSGRFSDASEIVREGLRLLEEREQDERVKMEWLRAAAKEGFDALDRGDFTEIRSEVELKAFMESIHREAVSELARDGNGV
jgi:antitoxin ParD1/3/4